MNVPQPSQCFTREQRILRADEYSSVFHMRPCCRTAHFALHACKRYQNQPRLGVVLAKRFAVHSVSRNLVKRVTRETFRIFLNRDLPTWDYIVRLRAPLECQYINARSLKRALRMELLQLFDSAPKS